MAVERTPLAGDYADELRMRGTGKIDTINAYLRADPISYYYEKLKGEGNQYLRDDFWSEAARRGESEQLIYGMQQAGNKQNTAFDLVQSYGDMLDYDTYMLAMQYNMLDDSEKKERIDQASGYKFGDYTDKEWAAKILEHTIQGWEAEILEANKENMNWFAKAGATIVGGLNQITSGAIGFMGDIYDIGRGLLNIFFNYGEDENIGNRFLWAFSGEDPNFLKQLKDMIDVVNYKWNRDFTGVVNAVEAHEQGYQLGKGSNAFEQINNTVGVGAGYTTWGRWWTAGMESIGYMLPSALIPLPVAANPASPYITSFGKAGMTGFTAAGMSMKAVATIKTGLYFTGIAAGKTRDAVSNAEMNGMSYKDLNAGTVLSNAALRATAEWAISQGLGYLMGFTGVDRMIGMGVGKGTTAAAQAATKTGAAALGAVLGRVGKSVVKEGLENMFQEISNGVINWAYGGNYKDQVHQHINIQNLTDAFVIGALVTVVTGAVKNANVVWDRAVGIKPDGTTYKMGMFQTLNLREAMGTIQQWDGVLRDSKSSVEAKVDAAFKMNAAMSTVGSLFSNFGHERAGKANEILQSIMASEVTQEQKKLAGMNNISYAQALFSDFMKKQSEASAKYVTDKLSKKITKALESVANTLKNSDVTHIDDVITTETVTSDPNIGIPKDSSDKIKQALKSLGVEAIVGVDGNIVTKSGDVIFADKALVQTGEVAEIVKGVAFEMARNAVESELTPAQKNLLTDNYEKIAGIEGGLQEAITALLFDKNFYLYTLLMSGERRYKAASIELLATIDKLISAKVSPAVNTGKVSQSAYKLLLDKIKSNMQQGLITFATSYAKLDLGAISNDVISPEIKNIISQNRNVLFTESVDKGLAHKKAEAMPTERVQEFDRNIEKFAANITSDQMALAKEKIRSTSYNDRVDAYAMLTQLAKSAGGDTKLIYLPSDPMNQMEAKQIGMVEAFFNISWNDLIQGSYDANQLSQPAKDFIMSNAFDMADNQSRLSAIRQVLFDKSGKALTVGNDGSVIKVLEAKGNVKTEFMGKDGQTKLLKAIQDGKVKTVQDIFKTAIDERIGKLKLTLDTTMKPTMKGSYTNGANEIRLNGQDIVYSVMHEATHATQFHLGVGQEVIMGGTSETFNLLPKTVSDSLTKYLKKNFGLTYEYLSSLNASAPQILYFMLGGELQANSTSLSQMIETGFRWSQDKSKLISPDGSQEWSMKPKKQSLGDIMKKAATTPAVTQGAPLDKAATTQANEGVNYYQGKSFYSGNAVVEGKGTWLSTNPEVAKIYGKGEAVQHDVNLAREDVLRIDAKGKDYTEVRYGDAYGTDAIASRIMQEGKYKAVEFVGIAEDGGMIGNTLFIGDSNALKVKVDAADEAIGARYISNKVAKDSNLKYFIKKGVPIQMDPGVSQFVISTTAEFGKLPKILQDKIKNGTLNKFDIIDYVATARTINDYTFQQIAKHVFKNDAMAKITHSDMTALMSDIEGLAAIAGMVDGDQSMTPEHMLQMYKAVISDTKNDPAKAKEFIKASRQAETVKMKRNGKTVYVESHADTKQLNTIFFRHFDGTLQSLVDINNLGKFMATQQVDAEFIENAPNVERAPWNWQDKMRRADVDYAQSPEVTDSLDNIDKQTKINTVVDYVTAMLMEKIGKLTQAQRTAQSEAILNRLKQEIDKIHKLKETDLNKRYLAALANEIAPLGERRMDGITAEGKGEPTTKTFKDRLRNLGRTITTRIAGLKTRFNSLSPEVQAHIDPENKYRLKQDYRNMSDAQLQTLIKAFAADSKKLRQNIRRTEINKQLQAKTEERMAKKAATMKAVAPDGTNISDKPKTMREKIQVQYKTQIKNQTFSVTSPTEANNIVKQLLSTSWGKERMQAVQGVTTNETKNVSEGKVFFEENAKTLLGMTVGDAEATARWFLDAVMNNVTDAEFRKFSGVKTYFLSWVLSEMGIGKQFYGMDPNLKSRIERTLGNLVSDAGLTMAIWNNVQKLINPYDSMKNANLELAGVELTDAQKDSLIAAAQSGDMNEVTRVQNEIFDYVNKEKTQKRDWRRKLVTLRSMAMLSSPMTWLRNRVSNIMLKRLNKISSAIGGKIASNKTVAGQLKMNADVTPEIQKFINDKFIDNKFFDTVVSNLSKYDFSQLDSRLKDATGKASKDAIFANMVIKSMYNQFYSRDLFNNSWMNKLHQGLFHMLSDSSYIREATIRYFGKILAERGTNITGDVTDNVMNDFAQAVGQGMNDYMHKDNFFNSMESWLVKHGHENALFAYKMLLPFASMSWNWFKAGITYSPIGLANSIYKLATLEKQVIKNEARFAKGQSNIAPDMYEYIVRRDLGSGILGTAALGLGILLSAMGYMALEDDDYGKPKLRIGNLRIDVSAIFGTSSIIAGAAMFSTWKNNGSDWNALMSGLDAGMDVLLDGFFLTDFLQMDKYNRGGIASFGISYMENYFLSFIPNMLNYMAGATYTGKVKKNNIWERAIAKIPFLANLLEKEVNPYTGEEGGMWDVFNRMVPYLSVQQIGVTEQMSKDLGLSKGELRGQYTINDERFNLSPKEVSELNKMYGQWNAADLAAFYNNQTLHTVTVNGKQIKMRFSQMTDDQRKATVQNIMNKNATYAKIQAWLNAGNAYYASATEYAALRKLGITGKLFKGNKGFVSQ